MRARYNHGQKYNLRKDWINHKKKIAQKVENKETADNVTLNTKTGILKIIQCNAIRNNQIYQCLLPTSQRVNFITLKINLIILHFYHSFEEESVMMCFFV